MLAGHRSWAENRVSQRGWWQFWRECPESPNRSLRLAFCLVLFSRRRGYSELDTLACFEVVGSQEGCLPTCLLRGQQDRLGGTS